MPDFPAATAKARILTTAESLFAQHGYTAVSLRRITTAAKVNVAAVNYHFYDCEQLYREILRLRLGELNRERLVRLQAAQERAAGAAVPLAEIFDALARPLLLPSAESGAISARLLGRILSERQSFADDVLQEMFQPVMTRFGQVLRRHQPALPPVDFVWRLSFVIGALHHTAVILPDMGLHTRGLCRAQDRASALENFTRFAAKAFMA